MRRLRDVGEHAWLARLMRRLAAGPASRRVIIGPGDDAAAIRPSGRAMLLTTDSLVETVHFRRGWMSPGQLGRRAYLVNASDLAAMGGVPTFALLALQVPPRTPLTDLDALTAGFVAAARSDGARLVGGNLTAAPRLAITVVLLGRAPGRIVTRRGARVGDVVYVTGTFGGAGLAVHRLTAGRRGRLPLPPRRVQAGVRLARVAHAMLDVSDGLLQDLGHLCRASGVQAEIELARIPVASSCRSSLGVAGARFAITAGEDYELVLTVPVAREGELLRLRPGLGCRVTRIGRIVAGKPAVRLFDSSGRRVVISRTGFDHFR